MLEGKTVAVVIPAFDEEALVATTIQGVPDFVDRLAPYADKKIEALKQRIADDQTQVDAIRRASASGDPLGRAVLAVQIGDVLDDQLQAKQLLIQAQEIERPKVLTRAAAVKTTARSRRNSVVVGAFLGLVLGLIAALVWEPITRRRK